MDRFSLMGFRMRMAFYSNAELDMLHIPAEDAARKAIRILNP